MRMPPPMNDPNDPNANYASANANANRPANANANNADPSGRPPNAVPLFIPCSWSFFVFLWGFVSLLRIGIGFHPHSGQDNHHGSLHVGAYGGDFEAQRHWMELTIHLPIGDWYWYDTNYWGLDYPPLTAYASWVCGWASHYIVGEESVALYVSRGIEDENHKAFMRGTVLVFDLLVYGTAVWYATFEGNRKSLWSILIALLQPALLLIDHGHFQYNSVALGLSIAAFSFAVQPDFGSCAWGGFFFVLALNFKQMTLYYAPVVFCYLLGRCASYNNAGGVGANSNNNNNNGYSSMTRGLFFAIRLVWLGGVVVSTFYVLWEPFVKYPPSGIDPVPTHLERLQHVLRRIFPFERGLFEGKVANLWCALNTSPLNIRSRIPQGLQPFLALTGTLALMAPSCYKILRVGTEEDPTSAGTVKKHYTAVLWAATSCALSFFLASFQVHEKSILLALGPCTLLFWQDPLFVEWFSFVCVWSLWPLLRIDRLHIAYWSIVTLFGSMVWFRRNSMGNTVVSTVFSGRSLLWKSVPGLSYSSMIGLHLAQALFPPPLHLPDLYEVLWSLTGCAMLSVAWVVTLLKLYHNPALSTPSAFAAKEKAD